MRLLIVLPGIFMARMQILTSLSWNERCVNHVFTSKKLTRTGYTQKIRLKITS